LGAIPPTVRTYSPYKRKSSELWLVHNQELHAEVCLKKIEILPIPCHIFSLMNSILNNEENFQTNSSIYSIDTRNKHHLHRPNANLSCFQKSTFYASIRIFNRLPLSLISLKNEKTKFKVALRKYLNTRSFYSVDEFFMYKDGS
jgi:hypothetical protein